ncbi:O-antigen ligase family protein [Roseiconus lacunae]|uniref:O-antigen ligase family protein n=1 Tax=Roseiconus lacunae TaxID=2605694 RepID=UPI001E5E4935|nr:O-antigen ligase family protein [Roseiconus lacunae]MCD0463155.1 O-antigen ligase family protein [Roseiconus lacunae]
MPQPPLRHPPVHSQRVMQQVTRHGILLTKLADMRTWLSSAQTRTRFCIAVIYLLPLLTYTTPGIPPENAGLDRYFALTKAILLASTVAIGSLIIVFGFRSNSLDRSVQSFGGWLLFFAWAVTTISWSPLKTVSLSQAGGLFSLLLHSIIVASVCDHRGNVSRLFRHLCQSLILLATFIVTVYVFDPVTSGLDREILNVQGDGLVHPTASGAAAALGLLLATIAYTAFRFHWSARVLAVSILTCGPLLLLSNSRTATVLAGLIIPVCLFSFGSPRRRGAMIVGAAVLSLVVIIVDPGFTLIDQGLGSSVQYLMRGQDLAQLRQASGRQEMWTAIWSEYLHAPLTGHGYYVTSRTGSLYVWNHFANHTAHNIYLQIFAGTGLIGFTLWSVAMVTVIVQCWRLWEIDRFTRHLAWSLFFCALWYMGWSLGSASFMGPLRYESVIAFTLLGIGVGQSYRDAIRNSRIST